MTPPATGPPSDRGGIPSTGNGPPRSGEVTTMRRLAGELAARLEQAVHERRRRYGQPPPGRPGPVTESRSISRDLVRQLESYAGGRLRSALVLRYLAWSFGLPLALLLLLHALAVLIPAR